MLFRVRTVWPDTTGRDCAYIKSSQGERYHNKKMMMSTRVRMPITIEGSIKMMQREWDYDSGEEEPLVTEPESLMLGLMEVSRMALAAVKRAAKTSGVVLPYASLVGLPDGMPETAMEAARKLVTEGVAHMGRRVMHMAFYMGGNDMFDNVAFVTCPFLLHVFVRILAAYRDMPIPPPFLEPLAPWRPVPGDDSNYADVTFYHLCLRLLMARKPRGLVFASACTPSPATMPQLPWRSVADLAPTYRSPNRGDGVKATRDYRPLSADLCVLMMDTYTALMRELADELTVTITL